MPRATVWYQPALANATAHPKNQIAWTSSMTMKFAGLELPFCDAT